MKSLLDLSKQPFPEEEISEELISSVTATSTLNTWIIEKGLEVKNFRKAKQHAKEAALIDFI
jgi:hypothetical protein